MSHLHRQLAAQQAVSADKDTCHTCVPVLPGSGDSVPEAKPRVVPKAKRKAKARRGG